MTYVNLESNSSFQPDQPLDFYLNTSLSGEDLFCKQVCDTMGHIALPVGQGNGDEVLPSVSNVPQKSPKEKLSVLGLPDHLPFPERFSIRVENAIRDGNVLSVRSQLIADISTFYYGLASHPQQGDYKRMALLTCEKFPSLKDSDPSKYWVRYDLYFSFFFSRKMII